MGITVREARDRFLADNGFSLEEYDADWVDIPIGPITIPLPSTDGRRKIVRWHDLHHVATRYGTDLAGEAEIGAFELRAGCESFAAYLYNGMAVFAGLHLAPLRTLRAWLDAKGARTLYGQGLDYDDALELTVDELRARMGLPTPMAR